MLFVLFLLLHALLFLLSELLSFHYFGASCSNCVRKAFDSFAPSPAPSGYPQHNIQARGPVEREREIYMYIYIYRHRGRRIQRAARAVPMQKSVESLAHTEIVFQVLDWIRRRCWRSTMPSDSFPKRGTLIPLVRTPKKVPRILGGPPYHHAT